MPSQRAIKYGNTEKPRYHCAKCDHDYTAYDDNFYTIYSPLAKEDGHAFFCKSCVSTYYIYMVEHIGDPMRAAKAACAMLGIYFSEELMDPYISSKNPIGSYITKLNRLELDKTYSDTVLDEMQKIEDEKQFGKFEEVHEGDIDLFGTGFSDAEYSSMHSFFTRMAEGKTLTFQEESDLASACKARTLADRAMLVGDTGNYVKLNDLYQKTILTFNERFKKEVESVGKDPNDVLGMKIRMIEQFTPAEFYKDKSVYTADKEYIERMIVRPLKNLHDGTSVEDPEYRIE